MKGTIMMMMCEIGSDSHHLVTGARVCWGSIMMPGMVSDVIQTLSGKIGDNGNG